MISQLHLIQLDFFFGAIGADHQRGFGGHVQQCTDRFTGPFPSTQFHHLPQQDQSDDDRCSLEIDTYVAVLIPKPIGKYLRRNHRNDTENIGGTHTHRDEAEHVQVHCSERLQAPYEERPTRPKDHRCCERELKPERRAFSQQLHKIRKADEWSHRQNK